MANNLTALEPIMFSVAQEVAQEPWGAIDSINTNFDDKGVAVGEDVKVPVAPARTTSAFTPAATPPQGADATATEVSVQITNSDKVSWYLTGEQIRSLDNGATSTEWIRQMLRQGMRALRNSAEARAVNAIKLGVSRALSGASPFGSNLDTLVDLRKILQDNGAPMADLQFVMDTTAGAQLRKLNIFAQADQAGSPEERRNGNFLRQYGFQLRESAGVTLHTAGAASGHLINGALAAGVTSLTVDTGTGDFNGGDLITVDGVTYAVNADTAAAGPVPINRPGTTGAIADNSALTYVGDYTPLLAFERDSVVGIMRPPIMPENPTIRQTLISDGEGMAYLLCDIAQYGQRSWELHLASGFKAVQPEFIAAYGRT